VHADELIKLKLPAEQLVGADTFAIQNAPAGQAVGTLELTGQYDLMIQVKEIGNLEN
jgi:hypothetical protein